MLWFMLTSFGQCTSVYARNWHQDIAMNFACYRIEGIAYDLTAIVVAEDVIIRVKRSTNGFTAVVNCRPQVRETGAAQTIHRNLAQYSHTALASKKVGTLAVGVCLNTEPECVSRLLFSC
jgi:hypothetical protein